MILASSGIPGHAETDTITLHAPTKATRDSSQSQSKPSAQLDMEEPLEVPTHGDAQRIARRSAAAPAAVLAI